MRVFVTGTGRCGSVSFRHACSFITNYQTGHETRNGLLEYPDNFIEVNPHFRKCILTLYNKYPDAKFVHLIRKPEDCIPSLAKLNHGAIMQAYEVLHPSIMPTPSPLDVAWRFYWCENDLIELQMQQIPENQRVKIQLEDIKDNWRDFWNWIGANGKIGESLRSWDTPQNTGLERGE